jgi:plasmid stabilization system protein ParE
VTSRPFQFHPEAELELTEAAEWYEERGAGLGREFLRSVRAKVDEIRRAPERWPSVRGTRRALVARFPYAVVYRELPGDMIRIIAIAHVRRRPRYWSAR